VNFSYVFKMIAGGGGSVERCMEIESLANPGMRSLLTGLGTFGIVTPLFVPQMLLMPFPHLYERNKSAELGALSVATFSYAVKLCGKCSKTTRNNKAY
jgi:hypothetical protein